ncbi:hypothetical protein B9G53_16595 [Pseudanabaena sp. SR411]|uniref:hypothetical protein n=1 Tax=Pseudanabaena sp. SR411 TaxID=1980935 RepID=UPI000B98E363|nr:hypothetical protein [Pseudanabaena sp. SR411]OYQ63513.1 hypothetical protein B9G53_16595 [Pseudanabaena sp. SR411]
MEIVGAVILVLVIICGASQNWKLSIKAILVIVIIEGALRRWAFPQARDLIYFFKDLVLIGSYIGFASQPRSIVDRYPFIKELTVVITIICCLQAFNPSLGSPIIGLLGIRAYLLYIPLVWILPHLFDSEIDLRNFLRNYLFLSIPVCILGIIQFFSPADSPLNLYVAGEESGIAKVGEFVRITGTFSYLAGLTVFLAVCFTLLIVLISEERAFKWQIIYGLELALVTVNSFMSGARGIILYEIIFTITYLISLFFTSHKAASNFIVRLFVPITIAALLAVIYFQPALQAFSDRVETASDSVSDRIIGSFTQVFSYAGDRSDGYGIGATQSGAASLRRLLDLPNGEELPTHEGETGRVMIELGLLGFILWYGLRIVLLISLFSVFSRLRHPFYKDLALAIFLFQLINITGQLVTNPTMLVYFWFFSGFIYLLPVLEDKERQRISLDRTRDSNVISSNLLPNDKKKDE